MGTIWRSEEMHKVQIFVQIEAAHDTVHELGKLGLIEFTNLNQDVNAFQKNFVNEVKRCSEMSRQLRFFDSQIEREKETMIEEQGRNKDDDLVHPDPYPELETFDIEGKKINMDELEAHLDSLEKDLIQMNNNQEMLFRNYNELIELRHVLTKDAAFFYEDAAVEDFMEQENNALLAPNETTTKTVKLGFVTGVIDRSKFISFERILWRATRGNLFMKHAEIEEKIRDPTSGQLVEKYVFIIFYQGERSQAKIKKICETYGSNLYPCPDSSKERKELHAQVSARLEDLEAVLNKSKKHRRKELVEISKKLPAWKLKVFQETSIYDTMNKFNYDTGRRCLIAEGWCPKNATDRIVNVLRQASESSGALVRSILQVVPTREEPPTHFPVNKFTHPFQEIVLSYGIARYGEVNPAVFTIVTFPFLFGVMFGDFGHGILMTLFSAALIWKEEQLAKVTNELVGFMYKGRYIMILMGIFSMYVGLIYNEMFSVALNIFGTNWEYPAVPSNSSTLITANQIYPGRVYVFGVDPAWNGASNSLGYYNSLKMKLSVLLGVCQMSLGIAMSAFNHVHFGHSIDIVLEFIPQIIFLWSLFGYLCFLIIFKWCKDWTGNPSPPQLLNVMIKMFLSPGSVSDDLALYDNNIQAIVQGILVIVAVLAVPVMLLGKPLYLRSKHKKALAEGAPVQEAHGHGGEEGHGFDFGEVMVKQTIHTIEFVLGAVSNTASYLRLWALSLAHSELSLVFWERIFLLALGLQMNVFVKGLAVFIAFGVWAGLTLGVLMVMESLSAFLHALRLHWVEFQNKFYQGDGRRFKPFSYVALLNPDED